MNVYIYPSNYTFKFCFNYLKIGRVQVPCKAVFTPSKPTIVSSHIFDKIVLLSMNTKVLCVVWFDDVGALYRCIQQRDELCIFRI